MTPAYSDPLVTLYLGDCLEVMAELPADSVDAVVTDPPYGLEFMGKRWDAFKSPGRGARVRQERASEVTPAGKGHTTSKGPFLAAGVDQYIAGHPFQEWCEAWGREALRVTKPGGYLLAFGGTRTHHRLVCGLEDAGWIIRDELTWVYASGFPKGKANLKPAHEPIVLARKPGPLRPLGIDECRIGTPPKERGGTRERTRGYVGIKSTEVVPANPPHDLGRWPSNVLLDPDSPALFDEPNPWVVGSGATTTSGSRTGEHDGSGAWSGPFGKVDRDIEGDAGGYSRFFTYPVRMGVCQFCGAPNAESSSSATTTPDTLSGSTPESARTNGSDGTESPAQSAASGSSDSITPTAPRHAQLWDDEGSGSSAERLSTSEPESGSSKSNVASTGSTRKSKRPGTSLRSASPSDPAMSAEVPATSSGTTTTTRSRWTCDACAALVTQGFTPAGMSIGPEDFPEVPASRPDSPRYLIIPKADRAERERGLAGAPKQHRGVTNLNAVMPGEYEEFVHPVPEGIGQWLREQREAVGLQQKQVAAHFPSKTGGLTGCVANWELEFNRPTPDQWRKLREVIGFDDRYDEVMTTAKLVERTLFTGKAPPIRANHHPTVKPIDLMRHLVRLVTPPGGVILDPFLGSGTTCLAASEEGFKSIGIERELEYLEIAKGRLMATPMGMGLDAPMVRRSRKLPKNPGKESVRFAPEGKSGDKAWFNHSDDEEPAA